MCKIDKSIFSIFTIILPPWCQCTLYRWGQNDYPPYKIEIFCQNFYQKSVFFCVAFLKILIFPIKDKLFQRIIQNNKKKKTRINIISPLRNWPFHWAIVQPTAVSKNPKLNWDVWKTCLKNDLLCWTALWKSLNKRLKFHRGANNSVLIFTLALSV